MSQQERKAQEGQVVRRLTGGAGATALGLAWFFTASAATAAPVAFGASPAADPQQPVSGPEQLDDRVFVRRVHVPAMRAPAGGVKAGTVATMSAAQAGSVGPAAGSGGASGGQAAAAGSTSSAPTAAQPAPAPVATPRPTPTATTGGSTPAK